MSNLSRLQRGFGLGVVMAALCCFASVVEAVDYPEYEFQKLLMTDDYLAAVESLDQERLDIARLERLKHPAFATVIDSVVPGGQADQAGVVKGWVIASINGIPSLAHNYVGTENLREEKVREMLFFLPTGEQKVVKAGPGMVGFNESNYYRPEFELIQKAPRGEWDKHLLVAVLAWELGRHDITETALYWAVNSGMTPNIYSTYWAAMLALDHDDPETSRKLMKVVESQVMPGKERLMFFRNGLRTLAFAHHDWDLLEKVLSLDSELRDKPVDEAMKSWGRWQPPSGKSLLERAQERAGPNRVSELVNVDPSLRARGYRDERGIYKAKELQDGRVSGKREYRTKASCLVTLPDGMKEVMISLKANITYLGEPTGPLPLHFNAALVDREWRAQKGLGKFAQESDAWYVAEMAMLKRQFVGNTLELAGGPSGYAIVSERPVPRIRGDKREDGLPTGWFDLKLIRIGDEAAIYVDGTPILEVPVRPEVEELGFLLTFSGVNYEIKNLQVQSILTAETP